jgi:hypothetical protein
MKPVKVTLRPIYGKAYRWLGEDNPQEIAKSISEEYPGRFAARVIRDEISNELIVEVTDLKFSKRSFLHLGLVLIIFEHGLVVVSEREYQRRFQELDAEEVIFKDLSPVTILKTPIRKVSLESVGES